MTTMLGDMLVRYRADISDLTSKVASVKSEMSSVPPVAEKTGTSIFSGFANGVKGALHFGSQLGMTVFGIKSLADTAIGLGSALLEPNASMEQTTVGFETLLGKGQKTQAFMKDLQSFADSTPFEFPQLAQDAEHMLAFGFNAQEVLPDLTAIGDALSAMGKSNADIDAVVTVFGQMKAAGKVNAQDMMQLTSQGIPAWKILADSMHLSVAQVQDLSQKGLLPADQSIKALTKGMEKMFGGGMKAQATTFNGQLSTLKDKAGEAMRSFTGPLFDLAKQGLSKLGDLVSSPAFQQFAVTLGKDIGGALTTIGTVIGGVADGIGKMVGWFRDGSAPAQLLGMALLAIGTYLAAIKIWAFIQLIPGLVGGFLTGAASAWTMAAGVIAATWPILAIIAAIGLVILVIKNWGVIGPWLAGIWKVVTSAIGGWFSWLGTHIHDLFAGIGKWFGDRVQDIKNVFSGIGTWLRDRFQDAYNFVTGVFSAIGTWFNNNVVEPIKRFWQGLVNWFKGNPATATTVHTDVTTGGTYTGGYGAPYAHAHAMGTNFAPGGLSLLGEKRPELVLGPTLGFLARGSTVIPYPISPSVGGGVSFGGGGGQGQTFILEVDGVQLAKLQARTTDRLVRLKLGAGGRSA